MEPIMLQIPNYFENINEYNDRLYVSIDNEEQVIYLPHGYFPGTVILPLIESAIKEKFPANIADPSILVEQSYTGHLQIWNKEASTIDVKIMGKGELAILLGFRDGETFQSCRALFIEC
jgi:hypothetical protein